MEAMASAPSEPGPVRGRVDRDGRLVSADPELAALQADAGSHLGARLALPQIAAIARLARSLGIPVTRPAIAADRDRDLELWVRAEPSGDDVELTIDGWAARPAGSPRLNALGGSSNGAPEAHASFEWAADAELKLTSMSAGLAKLLGISASDAVGQSLMRLFRLEEGEDGEMPLVSAVAARQSFAGQRAHPRAAASGDALVLSADVVFGSDGGFAGYEGRAAPLGHGADTKDSPASHPEPFDEALDEALRTPLDRIIACAEQIAAGTDGPLRSDYLAYASDISTAAKHLLSVVESMNEQPVGENETVDLAALAAEAVVMLEPTAEERGISFVLETARSLGAKGEERAVIQVLVNLISNAVRHSPEGGTVTIRFRRGGAEACVIVQDEGTGIDPADQQRIFKRFERAGAGEGGTGLGLAISRRLARSMGGDIELESAPGQGARFTVKLPRA
jgi:anti-sigma regulatory factor (Ser/Thr protein kinase)